MNIDTTIHQLSPSTAIVRGLERLGCSTAKELAKVAGCSQEEVYERLVALEARGRVKLRVSFDGKRVIERLWIWVGPKP